MQVCRGLAAAHDHGAIHRDLKPENLFLTADGQVKILDFGLAKQTGPAADADELPRAETRSAITEAGRVMGTAGYMSPEQAQGQKADARSDIFALGAVLYEMLSGRRAFAGSTPVDTVAAVLRSDPPEIRAEAVPPGLDRVVRRCLEKDPGERFQSAHDLGLALETLSGVTAPGPRPKRRHMVQLSMAAAVAILGILVLGMWRLWVSPPAAPAEPVRIIPFTADGGVKWAPRLSPDGERIAYAWSTPSQLRWGVYVKGLGRGARASPLTDHGKCPVWSPDGRQIAFVREFETGATIHTVPSFGGQERRLLDIAGPVRLQDYTFITSLSWSPDGEWLALCERPREDEPARIVKVSLTTLEKTPLTVPPAGTLGDLSPELSPDGRTLAFFRSASRTWGRWDVWVQPVSRSQARQVTFGHYDWCSGLAWTPDGKELLFSTSHEYNGGGRIFRVPVTGGAPAPPAGIGSDTSSSGESGRAAIYVVDSEGGVPQRLTNEPSEDGGATFSRDGRSIYFASDRSGRFEIWRMPATGGPAVQVTHGGGFAAQESWDARHVYYSKTQAGKDLWRVPVEGGEETPVLGVQPAAWTEWTLSRAGIYWTSSGSLGYYAIHFFDFESGRSEMLFSKQNLADAICLAVSPDEKWILYAEQPNPESELMLVENFR